VVIQAGQSIVEKDQPSALRYLVKPGNTLWDIAAANYHDVVAGIRAIQRGNGLKGRKILAGEILVIPVQGAETSH
jgi:LysM repeat protein